MNSVMSAEDERRWMAFAEADTVMAAWEDLIIRRELKRKLDATEAVEAEKRARTKAVEAEKRARTSEARERDAMKNEDDQDLALQLNRAEQQRFRAADHYLMKLARAYADGVGWGISA